MATKQEWEEYFEMINDRVPTSEDFEEAVKKGEITNEEAQVTKAPDDSSVGWTKDSQEVPITEETKPAVNPITEEAKPAVSPVVEENTHPAVSPITKEIKPAVSPVVKENTHSAIAPIEEEEQEPEELSVFASGVPEWTLEPPAMPIRRKSRAL